MARDPIRVSRVMRAFAAFTVALLVAGPASAGDRITGRAFGTRSEVIAPHAMAATSQPLATQVALDVMRRGGSAVDAAIAANAALGLMEPTGCGVGGDLFAIVWDPRTKQLHGYNGSGRSPRGLTLEQMKATLAAQGLERIPPRGPLPVSVPGAVDGWFALHARFGRLPMATLLAPAIGYARDGFPVSEVIASHWARNVASLAKYPGFTEQMTLGGRAPREGELWRNPNLAATYARIAKGGRDAFYKGDIARTIGAYMKANGGFLAYEDLAAHQGEWVTPVSVDYRGYRVWELPPNSQGLAALQMLQLLEPYDLKSMSEADRLHLMVEAKKVVFEDRARWYADPTFARSPVAALLAPAYAAERRKLIDMDRAARAIEAGNPALREGDTIYLTTADADGMMVSLIQSNYRGMGSGMTPPGLGFVLQDRGEMFALDAGHANAFAPAKRPFQTIIPAFITKDGAPWVAFGVMGGDMQPQGHVQIVVNLIDLGLDLQEAGDAPRWHHAGSSEPTGERMTDGGHLELESGYSHELVRELERRGHDVRRAGYEAFGGYQAIMRDGGVWRGASESRKDGQAAGY